MTFEQVLLNPAYVQAANGSLSTPALVHSFNEQASSLDRYMMWLIRQSGLYSIEDNRGERCNFSVQDIFDRVDVQQDAKLSMQIATAALTHLDQIGLLQRVATYVDHNDNWYVVPTKLILLYQNLRVKTVATLLAPQTQTTLTQTFQRSRGTVDFSSAISV